jgi:mannose/fructose-specific phosphotransferase system component IIA
MSIGDEVRGFRIVVVAHGDLAAALLSSAEMICGPIEDSRAVGLMPDHTPEVFAALLRDALGSGPCLVLADLGGGTPGNVALLVSRDRADVTVVAGVTLGMLIEAATSVTALDDATIEHLVTAGRAGVVHATRRLAGSGT